MVKIVANCFYVHKSNINELKLHMLVEDISHLYYVLSTHIAPFEVIKYNKKDGSISLIECDTWDILNEPIVGKSICYKKDGSIREIKGGVMVYHNKWQFVAQSYTGFDIEEAKIRTEQWSKIPGIKQIKSKIGSKKNWYAILIENNIPI